MNDNSKNASISTLIIMVLKDIRNERGVHQGHMAKAIGKSPSAWSKIENGQSPMTAEAMIGACWALQLYPSYIMTLVERITSIFNAQGYYFHTTPLEEEEDVLLPLIMKYFSSPGYEVLKNNIYSRISITNAYLATTPEINPQSTPTIIRYCCESNFRQWVDDGAEGWSPVPLQPGSGLPGMTASPPLEELVTTYDPSSNKPFKF
ncbi:hypothetical protein CG435_08485 [Pantoea ananatis]|uniref:helix-turn-helix domain-containing protein n=1 Tax=Pantoea ananas TaxID=553 RepID=UPI000CF45CAF|nr:helix-turn-helix transcriptional regulator [Pantoea ananatis]PQL00967.1 hypothetical protein CG435_08485 [Pantoea ananatis]